MGDNRLPIPGVTAAGIVYRGAVAGLIVALCVTVYAGSAAAAPEPKLVPRTWELEFTYEPPRPIAIADAEGVIRWYWFMTYKVVNPSASDRIFLPNVTVATDRGDIIVTNASIPLKVFNTIKQRSNLALLEHPIKVGGAIKPGKDKARQSVAMWPAFDHDVDSLSIFFRGLSGETATVVNPRTYQPVIDPESLKPQIDPRTGTPFIDPDTGKPKVHPRPLLLRKTLELRYHMPGSSLHPQNQPMILREKRWVMR